MAGLNIQIRNNIGLAIYLQIVERVRYLIFVGEIGDGDSLPSARALAEQLGINLNTVNRAYRQLQVEGLIESKPGRGARVTRRGLDPTETASRAMNPVAPSGGVDEMLTVALERALASGLGPDQIRARVDSLMLSIGGAPQPPLLFTVYAGPEWRSRRLGERLTRLVGPSQRIRFRTPGGEARFDTDHGGRTTGRSEIDLVIAFGSGVEESLGSDESRLVLPVHLDRESVRALLLLPPGVVPTVVAGDKEAGQWLVDTVSPLLGGTASPELSVATHAAGIEPRAGGYFIVEAGLPGLDLFQRQYPDRCVVAEMTFSQSAIDRLNATAG